jgi:Trypsin
MKTVTHTRHIKLYLKQFLAAHCMLDKGASEPRIPREILINLGGYDLNQRHEAGRVTVSPKRIIIHPDWNPRVHSYDADLAILELEERIQFTEYIKPICLWGLLKDPTATNAIVAGYGKSEDKSKRNENIPKILRIPIHSNEDCFLHEPNLAKLSSRRTFCGGAADGRGVCTGDSGSGLMIKIGEKYFLRGLVSSSLLTSEYECDVRNYGVYTNILKYKNWLRDFNVAEEVPDEKSAVGIDSTCGLMSSSAGLIQGGKFTSRNQFPWTALLYFDDIDWWCAGTLISNKHVVTYSYAVAEYFPATNTFAPDDVKRFRVFLGTIRENDPTRQGEMVVNPSAIILHPNAKKIDTIEVNLVAIVILETAVRFTEFIRPVCLWPFSNDPRWVSQ